MRAKPGRTFLEEEGPLGRDQVVFINYRYWSRRFAADPNVIGRTLNLNGRNYRVVGILPADLQYPRGAVSGLSWRTRWPPLRILGSLMINFSPIALVLAQAVAECRREFGIRFPLGAERADLVQSRRPESVFMTLSRVRALTTGA